VRKRRPTRVRGHTSLVNEFLKARVLTALKVYTVRCSRLCEAATVSNLFGRADDPEMQLTMRMANGGKRSDVATIRRIWENCQTWRIASAGHELGRPKIALSFEVSKAR